MSISSEPTSISTPLLATFLPGKQKSIAIANSKGSKKSRLAFESLKGKAIFHVYAQSSQQKRFIKRNWVPLSIQAVANKESNKEVNGSDTEIVWVNVRSLAKRLCISSKELRQIAKEKGSQGVSDKIASQLSILGTGSREENLLQMNFTSKKLRLLQRYVDQYFATHPSDGKKVEKLEKIEVDGKKYSFKAKLIIDPKSKSVAIFNQTIGKGSFKKVYKVADYHTGKQFVFAKLKPHKQLSFMIKEEFNAIEKLQSAPQVFTDIEKVSYQKGKEQFIGLQMPAYDFDLSHLPLMPKSAQLKILLDATCGIRQMHEKKWAHLDIKPDNILGKYNSKDPLASEGIVSDLGLAIDHSKVKLSFSGSALYQAPEIHRVLQAYKSNQEKALPPLDHYATDIWSLGMTLLQVTHGYSEDDLKLLKSDPSSFFRKRVYSSMPNKDNKLDRLIWDMLDENPLKRPEIVEVQLRLEAVFKDAVFKEADSKLL